MSALVYDEGTSLIRYREINQIYIEGSDMVVRAGETVIRFYHDTEEDARENAKVLILRMAESENSEIRGIHEGDTE